MFIVKYYEYNSAGKVSRDGFKKCKYKEKAIEQVSRFKKNKISPKYKVSVWGEKMQVLYEETDEGLFKGKCIIK